jgi:UDP-N-acetylglucosamine--N-acetylmuramyl-(pentapeptide) pyrophosphoryl-undecaprenol N-acetylglucosamine transferase
VKPIVIAAGGTGGHFFPAEALASVLLQRGERVVLMTDARSSAAKSPVFAGCETHVIAGAGLAGRSLWRAAKGAAAIARGVLAARRVMADLEPSVVVGFGGYPAVAPVLAARSLPNRPVLILHDQNASLGKANRFLAKFADQVALSFAATAGLPAERASVLTGNPVRPAIVARANAPYRAADGNINLLVLGGSLGARVFATLVPAALAHLPAELFGRISLTMQCPAASIETAQAGLLACGVSANLSPFFDDVAGLMADSHLVLARAGGSTVAELAVIGRPCVLVPLTINDDQRANANALAAAGGAVCVEQDEGAEALAAVLERLLTEPGKLAAMAAAASDMGIVDAATRLADLVQQAMTAETVA